MMCLVYTYKSEYSIKVLTDFRIIMDKQMFLGTSVSSYLSPVIKVNDLVYNPGGVGGFELLILSHKTYKLFWFQLIHVFKQ